MASARDVLISALLGAAGGGGEAYLQNQQRKATSRDDLINSLAQLQMKSMIDQNDPVKQAYAKMLNSKVSAEERMRREYDDLLKYKANELKSGLEEKRNLISSTMNSEYSKIPGETQTKILNPESQSVLSQLGLGAEFRSMPAQQAPIREDVPVAGPVAPNKNVLELQQAYENIPEQINVDDLINQMKMKSLEKKYFGKESPSASDMKTFSELGIYSPEETIAAGRSKAGLQPLDPLAMAGNILDSTNSISKTIKYIANNGTTEDIMNIVQEYAANMPEELDALMQALQSVGLDPDEFGL